MYNYNIKKALELFEEIFSENLESTQIQWICDKSHTFSTDGNVTAFFTAFTAGPRFVGKKPLSINQKQKAEIDSIKKGFTLTNYTSDHLARLWFLLHFPMEDEEHYVQSIDRLFPSAEMNELVALYSALPLLAYPERWKFRCTEGIRSNIGSVLESVICNNPYPSEYLNEEEWNQLVLKAFFTEKPINQIVGLDKRANQRLADTLSDFAHERWAAGRTINPLAWRLVGPYLNESLFQDIIKISKSGNDVERQAAALACAQSNYVTAKELLNSNQDLKTAIDKNELTWQIIAKNAGV
ncbi:MAG TPA: EboA domain-containing protein [Pedobacter sp.]|jgi:hypothetical protein